MSFVNEKCTGFALDWPDQIPIKTLYEFKTFSRAVYPKISISAVIIQHK